METWRLTDISVEDPYLNMAIEEAIPHAVGEGLVPPTLRLWQNDNAVIIGYFQSALQEVWLDECKKLGTAVIRRFTGGGAVYHDGGNINYAISCSEKDKRVPMDILESYRFFCHGVVRGLSKLDIRAEFAPINDVVVGGRKISGTAQTRQWGVVFTHGTLMVNVNIPVMVKVLRISEKKLSDKVAKSIAERVTTIALEREGVTVGEGKKALVAGFEEILGVSFESDKLTKWELDLAKKLREEKYARQEWNFKR